MIEEEFDYYKTPPQQVFEEIKQQAIEIWKTYEDGTSYSKEKIDRIKDLTNIKDNVWYIVAMFDMWNQEKLKMRVSLETAELINKARGY